MSDGEAIQPKHLRFRPPHTNVFSSPTTGIDETNPLNTPDSDPHLDNDTEISEETFLLLSEAMARYEGQYLRHALERTGGNRIETARLLNISRRTFHRKLAKYNL